MYHFVATHNNFEPKLKVRHASSLYAEVFSNLLEFFSPFLAKTQTRTLFTKTRAIVPVLYPRIIALHRFSITREDVRNLTLGYPSLTNRNLLGEIHKVNPEILG